MATRYQKIQAINSPSDALGLDESSRVQWYFNLEIWKHHSTTLEEEIVKLLEDASVGTWETDIFAGTRVTMPAGDGPYLAVLVEPGLDPIRTMNEEQPPASVRPAVKIIVRGTSYTATRTMAYNAWVALDGVYNQDVEPITP